MPDQRGREALLVLLLVLLVGATIMIAVGRLLHIGATPGNILFAALLLVATAAAAARFHHDD